MNKQVRIRAPKGVYYPTRHCKSPPATSTTSARLTTGVLSKSFKKRILDSSQAGTCHWSISRQA